MALEDQYVEGMKWPPPASAQRLLDLQRYDRLFKNDRATLLEWAQIQLQVGGIDDDDRYLRGRGALDDWVPYPAPEIAARTLSTFLFGEDAQITSDTAQDQIDQIIKNNHLHAVNQEAALSCAVDGEIYYKIDWDEDVSETAIVSPVASAYCFPLFRYRRLMEIAFVTQLDVDQLQTRLKNRTVYRHVEIRVKGHIFNRLFAGNEKALGVAVDLDEHPATEGLEGEVDIEIDDTLVRHVPFWRTSKSPHGISIFDGKQGLIEALHRLYSQDQHDAEMVKRRIALPSAYIERTSRGDPKWNRHLDIFELTNDAAGPVGAGSPPVQAIEFTDSTVMGDRIAQRIDEFFLACGIAPQSAGRDVAGSAESGIARKLAQSLTLQTVATAARYFRPNIHDVVDLALAVSAKHLNMKLTGAEPPIVKIEMKDGLVDDEVQQAEVLSALTTAMAISTEEKVRKLHPNWDDDAIQAEVERIKEDEGLKVPVSLGNVGGTVPPDEDEGGDSE